MNENKLDSIDKLINNNKIDQAQIELSKLGPEFFKNSEYLLLRGKIFYLNKLYYIALDTLLIATEFEENKKVYNYPEGNLFSHLEESGEIEVAKQAIRLIMDTNLIMKDNFK